MFGSSGGYHIIYIFHSTSCKSLIVFYQVTFCKCHYEPAQNSYKMMKDPSYGKVFFTIPYIHLFKYNPHVLHQFILIQKLRVHNAFVFTPVNTTLSSVLSPLANVSKADTDFASEFCSDSFMLPSILPRCRGVYNSCKMKFYLHI